MTTGTFSFASAGDNFYILAYGKYLSYYFDAFGKEFPLKTSNLTDFAEYSR
jgi:hypothetical protein